MSMYDVLVALHILGRHQHPWHAPLGQEIQQKVEAAIKLWLYALEVSKNCSKAMNQVVPVLVTLLGLHANQCNPHCQDVVSNREALPTKGNSVL